MSIHIKKKIKELEKTKNYDIYCTKNKFIAKYLVTSAPQLITLFNPFKLNITENDYFIKVDEDEFLINGTNHYEFYNNGEHKVIVSFKNELTSLSNLFYFIEELIEFELSNLNTSQVESTSMMFSWCKNLRSVDLTGFNSSMVTDMNYMFHGLNLLTSLDVSMFDTSNVIYMNEMFCRMNSLTSLDLSNFKTFNVTNMNCMFYEMNSLISLDLGNFETSQVRDMSCMFLGMTSLQLLNISSFEIRKGCNLNKILDGIQDTEKFSIVFDSSKNQQDLVNEIFKKSKWIKIDLSKKKDKDV